MTTIAYFDCPTGIAGDMCLGALVDAGVPLSYLQTQLAQLVIADEFELSAEVVKRNGLQATKVEVLLSPTKTHHHHRHLPQIQQFINDANLPKRATANALAVFENLAIAEGKVHNIAPDKVHFHEVGATDAIVDIVGTCLGLDYLNIDELYCSALPTGGGTVKAAHGRMPVPVPAVLELWQQRQVPVYANGIERELVTPTGAAIAVTLAKTFGAPPSMSLTKVGNGAGTLELPLPNVLRLWLGEREFSSQLETVAVLETQIDDATPQTLAYAAQKLLAIGALDVFSQPVTMKKNRLGTLLSVICPVEKMSHCEQILFQETPTLGIRRRQQHRSILPREFETVKTPYGSVTIKIARDSQTNAVLNAHPEYD
ncbi:MAG: nickel pincer cofactor biosynthesis protein LarC, partial [Cyanobacteria bacterium P01_H01_bin.15]